MNKSPQEFSDQAGELIWLERAVELLDDSFRIPGTHIRFGIDPLIGLFPLLGDMVGFAVSGFLVIVMVRNGASGMVLVKMIWNVLLDTLLGGIPILGIFFDVGYRANRRNLNLLQEYYEEGKHQGSARWLIITVIVVLIALLIGLTIFFVWLLRWLLEYLSA